MRSLIKKYIWILAVVLVVRFAWAFVPGGPIGNGGDSWQTAVIGYGLAGDLLAPKNIGEEYRRNIPTLYYAYDVNFLDFFGSNGPVSIDAAFTILNGLTNVDSYTTNLSEFPLETRQTKYEAQALGLLDLKSYTLGLMMEQLGLAEPERYTWNLRDRFHANGAACPANMEYLVVQRNLDLLTSPLNQLQYSPYVNGTLYSYLIEEFCTGPNPLAVTYPVPVDPLSDKYSPVADMSFGYGDFYTGLTRDDVAGLRYLWTTNNLNTEAVGSGAVMLVTNIATTPPGVLITTEDLTPLILASPTNSPTALQALFPDVVTGNTSSKFANICSQVVTVYFTNMVGAPVGSPQISVFVTNTVCSGQLVYSQVFANVITNANLNGNPNIKNTAGISLNYSPSKTITILTTSVGQVVGAPYGTIATNNTSQQVTVAGLPAGEFFTIPAGQCGWQIIPTTGFPNTLPTVYTTNVIASATVTNVSTSTNTTATSTNVESASQSIVMAFTPHQFVAQPITCTTVAPTPQLRQGIGNVKFVRANFDSLLGQSFQPITNYYSMMVVSNSQLVKQFFQRVVTTPDFTFTTQDMDGGSNVDPFGANGIFTASRNVNFDQSQILPNLAGPGVINAPTTITLNKAEPVYFNQTSQLDGTPYFGGYSPSSAFYEAYFLWSQFDNSTNEPVVFPNGTSILNLANQALIQVSPATLPPGTNGVSYAVSAGGPVNFTATGGAFTAPYTWAWSPVLNETLPPGLSLSTSGSFTGTPTKSGTYDFVIKMTDTLGRSVQWNYTLVIH